MVFKNQGLLQTLEKFQVLQTLIFSRSPPKKRGLIYTINLKKDPDDKLKKNPGVQEMKFF